MDTWAQFHNSAGTLSIDCRPLKTMIAYDNKVNYFCMALNSSYSILCLLAKPLNHRDDNLWPFQSQV